MKAGVSINRPVLARRLELDRRRRDYKIHLRTLKEQKCGTDFSHPPVVFRIQTVQKNANAKRKERKRYEDMCIEKMNEHYANKVMNSKSFRDPYLIEQVSKSCARKASPSSSQLMSPHTKSEAFKSSRSVKSTNSCLNKNNENECDNKYNSMSAKKSNKADQYNIPHYNLPPEILKMGIELEENIAKEQNTCQNKNFEFQFNQILDNEAENIETENCNNNNEETQINTECDNNNNNEETFEIHPPEGQPRKIPSRSSNVQPTECETQINTQDPENQDNKEAEQIETENNNNNNNEEETQINTECDNNNNNEETFEIRPPDGEPRKIPSRSSNVSPSEGETKVNNEDDVDMDDENFEDF